MPIKNSNFSNEEIDKIFKKSKKIFFIGIGGISLSTIATYCLFSGKEVFGYDREISKQTKRLEPFASIKYYSTPDSVFSMDMVIYSNAIDENNFEYKQAKKLKIPTLSRANFLSYIASTHKTSISVAGTHGKSTTVSFLAKILDFASFSPTVFCGAELRGYDSALLWGRRDFCILESCEYMDSFLCLTPSISGILNIEYDHPDYFKNEEEIKRSFEKHIKASRVVVINIDSKLTRELLSELGVDKAGFCAEGEKFTDDCNDCRSACGDGCGCSCDGECKCGKSDCLKGGKGNSLCRRKARTPSPLGECKKIITYSLYDKGAEYFCDVKDDGFVAYRDGKRVIACGLNLRGEQFISDAMCALLIALECGAPHLAIINALEECQGVKRRLEFIKKTDTGIDIFEDYAHHPTEIKASLGSLKKMGYSKILCIFQAHTFSRTHYLYKDFLGAFKGAYKAAILPTFKAREENTLGVSEQGFAKEIGGIFVPTLKDAISLLDTTECDCAIFMGAGDITNFKKYL